MLSDKIVGVIAALPYQPDAEWEVNILPFGSIYWKDEMPDIGDPFDRPEDTSVINAMFGMRLKLWSFGRPGPRLKCADSTNGTYTRLHMSTPIHYPGHSQATWLRFMPLDTTYRDCREAV